MKHSRRLRRAARRKFIARRMKLTLAGSRRFFYVRSQRIGQFWRMPGELSKDRRVYPGRKCGCEDCRQTPYNRKRVPHAVRFGLDGWEV